MDEYTRNRYDAIRKLLQMDDLESKIILDNVFKVIAERSIGLHWRGKRIVPPWAMPLTFSDNVIVKAILSK